MPSHFDPRIHPDCLKRDRATAFRDPFGYQLDTYETQPAHDLEDFVAYCFALTCDSIENRDLPGDVDEVYLVREQFIVLMIGYLAAYFTGTVEIGGGFNVATVDIGVTWRVVELSAEVVTFALAVDDDGNITERKVLLARSALDQIQDRWTSTTLQTGASRQSESRRVHDPSGLKDLSVRPAKGSIPWDSGKLTIGKSKSRTCPPYCPPRVGRLLGKDLQTCQGVHILGPRVHGHPDPPGGLLPCRLARRVEVGKHSQPHHSSRTRRSRR